MREFLDFEKPLKELEERIEKVGKSGSEKKRVPMPTKAQKKSIIPIERIASCIYLIRGEKVMLDARFGASVWRESNCPTSAG